MYVNFYFILFYLGKSLLFDIIPKKKKKYIPTLHFLGFDQNGPFNDFGNSSLTGHMCF